MQLSGASSNGNGSGNGSGDRDSLSPPRNRLSAYGLSSKEELERWRRMNYQDLYNYVGKTTRDVQEENSAY